MDDAEVEEEELEEVDAAAAAAAAECAAAIAAAAVVASAAAATAAVADVSVSGDDAGEFDGFSIAVCAYRLGFLRIFRVGFVGSGAPISCAMCVCKLMVAAASSANYAAHGW